MLSRTDFSSLRIVVIDRKVAARRRRTGMGWRDYKPNHRVGLDISSEIEGMTIVTTEPVEKRIALLEEKSPPLTMAKSLALPGRKRSGCYEERTPGGNGFRRQVGGKIRGAVFAEE